MRRDIHPVREVLDGDADVVARPGLGLLSGVATTSRRWAGRGVQARLAEPPVLTGDVDHRLTEVIQDVRADKDALIVELGAAADHARLLAVGRPESRPNGSPVPLVTST